MPAPKNPNPEPGAAARRKLGDATAAARLRKHGWLVFSPKVLALLPPGSVERLKKLSEGE